MQCSKLFKSFLLNPNVKWKHKYYTTSQENFDPFTRWQSTPFIDTQYKQWLRDPNSLEPCWDYFFQNSAREISTGQGLHNADGAGGADSKTIDRHLAVQTLIRSYQSRGHIVAKLDPLEIQNVDRKATQDMATPPDNISSLKVLTEQDLNSPFTLPETTLIGGSEKVLPLKEIIKRLEFAYCNHIGLEYMYIYNLAECDFLRQKFEPPGAVSLTKEEKIHSLGKLCETHGFEAFLARKWTSEKRFGVEGGDIFIPIVQKCIDVGCMNGCESFIMGMAHRGRLNMLANICHQPLSQIFAQFHGLKPDDEGSGDVKYHLGCTVNHVNEITKKPVQMCLVANPSHLEAVNPVALGKCRAEQFYKGDTKGDKVQTILVHGDASFCGQGIAYESIHLSYLPLFTTHGCIHMVINNQVGFTTDPRFSRSSRYCTDVGKVVNAPILHVNGDDAISSIYVAKVAAEFRAKFHKDVIIDIVCYRRRGHNEADQPMFTQPLMYTKISKMEPVFMKFSKELVKSGDITEDHVKKITKDYDTKCEAGFDEAKKQKTVVFKLWLDSKWKGFFKNEPLKYPRTGISKDILEHIVNKFSSPPGGDFVIHKGIQKILETRKHMVDNKTTDFAMGEAIAFGSLLNEGVHVRLSGEDVERGTFSHRHHVIHHQKKDAASYNFISSLYPNKGVYLVCNSALSEYGVMGFEHGYSLVNPMSLVIWEGQFGDFFNGAQTIVDTYLSAGEAKWTRQCGMVLNLPHGMDGMGPEHSSARVERFLQMCVEDEEIMPNADEDFAIKQLKACNWIIVNCSTPGSYCHALRRQLHMPFRKILINMSPKFVLRHPEARSSFDEYLDDAIFERIIPDRGPASKNPDKVKKLVFCSGRVYYDLIKTRREKKLENEIAVSRLEQISPFPFDLVKMEVAKYPKAHLIWCQEEHKNSGPWHYVKPRFKTACKHKPKYMGRPNAAAPATGSKYQHVQELQAFLADFVNIID